MSTRLLQRVAEVEGASLLLLLFVAMPLKYAAGLSLAVRVVGMVHGVLFLALLSVAFRAWVEKAAPGAHVLKTLGWSLVPFGFLMTRAPVAR